MMAGIDWDSTDDVLSMMHAVGDSVSSRRCRLLMLAFCESVPPPPSEIRSFPQSVQFLRQMIDGRVKRKERDAVVQLGREEAQSLDLSTNGFTWWKATMMLMSDPAGFELPWQLLATLIQATTEPPPPPIQLRRSQVHADLVREVIGPLQSLPFVVEWRTETVRLLADGIHADQAYDRLPILADALEEAGCDNAELLNHCRGLGPHVLGCWVLDVVRGVY